MPATNNDITVAENKPMLSSILYGRRTMKLLEGYVVDGVQRDWNLYYLVYGIYQPWSIFLKPIHTPINIQRQAMKTMQEPVDMDSWRVYKEWYW